MFKELRKKIMKNSYIKAVSIIVALSSLIMLSGGCSSKHTDKVSKEEITVFAASSLTESLEEVIELFKQENPQVKIRLNVDSTSRLRVQIQQGVQGDIFLSANKEHYDVLKEQGYILEGEVFLYNSMVLIVPEDNPAHIENIEDLQNKCKLVLAQKEVPAGGYAREIIHSLSGPFGAEFEKKVLNNIVSEENNVKQVVNKVVIGEADAAFVYLSDVTQSVKQKVKVLSIPPEHNSRAEYWTSKLTKENQSEYAQRFYDFLISKEGQETFEKYGFKSVE